MSALPLVCRWTGHVFEPIGRSKSDANNEYAIGQVCRLAKYEDRSEASHNHYFAAVSEAWANLPDPDAWQFPSPEALRKRALIMTGFATQRQYVAQSRKEAERVAAFLGAPDEVVTITGNIVTVLTAESQSYRSMGKARFQESKEAVLGYVAGLIGVDPETLHREAGRAA
jgi:hypothetical protein